ncbi:polymer-forming cytoskeletal protein [Phenylobacterium sp.]|uniref:bactofilin family protein n=1 Tax=Phenylobacterium sp. TaxID=1871053 RepID=UPI00272F9F57|nr:polymer-forming cytoskeletal protein [Phenylobacterium sp.]MDP1873922.1 polymer-forming cytoskeletal protein [Phenylobacterium sp.]
MFSKQPTKSDTTKSPARLDAPPPALSEGATVRKTPTVASLIAENLTVEGGISGEGELHIDGIVRGDIRIGKLTIGDTGHVEGSIYAEAVEARGRVIGAITAKQVRLYGTCYVDGDITHEQLAMETGAFFQGRSLKFQRPPPPPAEAPPKPAPVALEGPAPAIATVGGAPQPKPVF